MARQKRGAFLSGTFKIFRVNKRTSSKGETYFNLLVGWRALDFGEWIPCSMNLTVFGDLDVEVDDLILVDPNEARFVLKPSSDWEMSKDGENFSPVRFPEALVDAEAIKILEKGDPTGYRGERPKKKKSKSSTRKRVGTKPKKPRRRSHRMPGESFS